MLSEFPAASIDSCVTDPPYHLQSIHKRFAAKGRDETSERYAAGPYGRTAKGFMGKQWDGGDVAFRAETWVEVLRVLKPGGHLIAFGGTRTYHRMACAIEDAGFEIRDQIGWAYGSGFPKSHNAGDGWGTALKPAWEPIVLARRPLIGTVAKNVAAHGTGAINIDGCRVGVDPVLDAAQLRTTRRGQRTEDTSGQTWGLSKTAGNEPQVVHPEGRWPANLVHDGSDEVLDAFPIAPGQQGALTGDEPSPTFSGKIFGKMKRSSSACEPRGDAGSAARFFYCAKATRADREDGCDALPLAAGGMLSETSGQHITRRDGGAPGLVHNNHPTVKPTKLMQWLCRLVTPIGGTVLDPFVGSGSTGRGAVLEGFSFVGIEADEGYAQIANARIVACISGIEALL